MINAKIVADSKNEFGNRITTMILTYPRIIHSEFMTHRVFSRNAASSRAVPASKLIEAVKNNPFIPLAFQKNHSGMQGTEYITDQKEIDFEIADWLDDRDYAVKKAEARLKRDVTKQLVNRPLETFQYYTTIVTATEWENFFILRCPSYQLHGGEKFYRSWRDAVKDYPGSKEASVLERLQLNKGQAEIHMMTLAECMWDAYNESVPKQLKAGAWHIPYEDQIDDAKLEEMPEIQPASLNWYMDIKNGLKVKISTVMAARTSYTVVGEDQKPMTYKRMVELHDQMRDAKPIHASPFEHCGMAMGRDRLLTNLPIPSQHEKLHMPWSGNFQGFTQYRQIIENK